MISLRNHSQVRQAAQHAHAGRPPSARKILAFLKRFYAARLRRRLMRNPLGGRPSYLLLSVVPILCYNHAKLTREIPPMFDNLSPAEHIRQLFEQRLDVPDEAILAELTALPVLPDEQDPVWEDERTWYELADRFVALADLAAHRRLYSAIPLLLERASYGDPGEMMRGLRHSLEAIVKPEWHRLTDICIQMAQAPQRGARLWSINELGILRDPRAVPTLINSLDDPADQVRVAACQSLEMVCQRHVASRPMALQALQRYLEHHLHASDQRAGKEAIATIGAM